VKKKGGKGGEEKRAKTLMWRCKARYSGVREEWDQQVADRRTSTEERSRGSPRQVAKWALERRPGF